VGAPIETHLGFEIVQRTAPRPRTQFRARLFVHSGPLQSGPPDPAAERALLSQANAAARSLASNPARFEQMAEEILQWQDGRGIPGLSLLLPALRPGQVTASAVPSEYGAVIAQRLAPEAPSSKQFATELPAPEQPDVERFLGDLRAADSQAFLRALVEHARAALALPEPSAERLREQHALQGRLADGSLPETRLEVFHGIIEGARQLLGEQQYAWYRAELSQRVRDALLGPTADLAAPLGM
jgi:hypothetical protein